MPGKNDPNDPVFSTQPGRFVFQNGEWMPVNGGGSEFWNDPQSSWSKDFGNLGTYLGYQPKHAEPTAPGGQVDTSQADEERKRTGVLLGQLQQQAATGGGAWEGSLHDATQKASSTAMALGQSQPGVGYASALRSIGNAQGATSQRAAGQANILRAQSQQGAQDQLSGLLGAQGGTDAQQAAAGAAAQQGITELNNTLASNANKQITKDSTSFGGLAAGAMSDGGAVPGKPQVGGDDPKNDTVSAMLSPGEIVIPRSHAGSPEAAADFVRALQSRGPQRMAGGGTAGDGTGLSNPTGDQGAAIGGGIASILAPHIGAMIRGPGINQAAPSIQNGGLLDTQSYDQTRTAQLANSDLIGQRAAGQGPSIAPQQMQNAADENIAAAMQAGGNRGQSAGDILQRSTAATQGAGGNAAATAGNEQASAQQGLGRALAQQRAADLAIATAKQQAAFRQTQINAGLGLEQQAALRGLLGGAGQAAMAGSAVAGHRDQTYDLNDKNAQNSFDSGFGGGFNDYPGNKGFDIRDAEDKAEGGYVGDTRGQDFIAALKRQGYR